MSKRWIAYGLAVVVVSMAAGCALVRKTEKELEKIEVATVDPKVTMEQLLAALDAFENLLGNTVENATHRMINSASTPDQREAAILWRLQFMDDANTALNWADPRAALAEGWSLCYRMRKYLESEGAVTTLGEGQPIALEAVIRLERQIVRIAAEYIPPDALNQIRVSIEENASEVPIGDNFTSSLAVPEDAPQQNLVMRLINAPLAPLRSLGEAPSALRDAATVGDRIADVVEGLPANTRWQLRLLLLQLDEVETVRAALDGLASFAKIADQLTTTAEELPPRIREDVIAIFSDLDARQENLRTTLREARDTLDAVNDSLARAERISAAADEWTTTAEAVHAVVEEISRLQDSDADEEPGRPFDITEYSEVAVRVTESAAELRGALADLGTLTESDNLSGRLGVVNTATKDAVDHTAAKVEHLVDYAFWRLAALIVVFFVLAVVYRLLTTKRQRPARE